MQCPFTVNISAQNLVPTTFCCCLLTNVYLKGDLAMQATYCRQISLSRLMEKTSLNTVLVSKYVCRMNSYWYFLWESQCSFLNPFSGRPGQMPLHPDFVIDCGLCLKGWSCPRKIT
jgi:hypothetical protein